RTRCFAEAGRKRSEPVHPAAGTQHAGPGFGGRLGESLKKVFQLGASLLLLLSLADAQQTRVYREGGNWAQEITGNLAAAKNLHVKVDVGTVRVQGGSQSTINYVIHNPSYSGSEDKARREFDSYKISTYVRGDTAWIVGDWQGGRSHRFSSDFSIDVPRNMDWVKVETDGGSVTTTGISGRVDATSGGGTIRVDDIGGNVNAETGGGSIDAGAIGGDLSLHTGGGSIKVGSAKGKVSAEGGGGSIELNGVPSARAETGAGGIVAKFISSGDRSDSTLETSAGDITIYLAPNLNISIRASIEVANSHSIHTDFSEIRVSSEGGD